MNIFTSAAFATSASPVPSSPSAPTGFSNVPEGEFIQATSCIDIAKTSSAPEKARSTERRSATSNCNGDDVRTGEGECRCERWGSRQCPDFIPGR